MKDSGKSVTMVPVDSIHVLNPRERNKGKFKDIVDSISLVGLKKPITVSRRPKVKGEENYTLVCGQGRLEAFKMLEQKSIPAIVVDLPDTECYLMSLVENLARRQHSPLELIRDISTLSERGYSIREIGKKAGLSRAYVTEILHLVKHGEERLIHAVETNQIPINVAVEISNSDDGEVQKALAEAYERNDLRGTKLQTARRVVQQRQQWGKTRRKLGSKETTKPITAQTVVRAYKRETERQRAMVLKADLTEKRLLLIISVLRELFGDENFRTLLRAEGLDTLPKQVADLVMSGKPRE